MVPTIPIVNSEDGGIVVPTIPTADSEEDGGIVVPTFNGPPETPPTTKPGGGNWHKGGWANDLASTYGPGAADGDYSSYDDGSSGWI